MPSADRVSELFEAAIMRDPVEWPDFLDESCAGDAVLRRQLEEMLDSAGQPLVIDRPVDEAVAELLGGEYTPLAGTQVGPYRVEELLGAGGMGEVYRAVDTVLGRRVAIKVLPADLGGDPDRTARFRREAMILASLNHPNIAAIYGVEPLRDGRGLQLGLVLELVEGPTLAERLASGPLPSDEALVIARQLAEALDVAHQQGIVHRDLKPGNIKVRGDGTVKVLDFGLAKLASPTPYAASDSQRAPGTNGHASTPAELAAAPTITTPAVTAAGIILGTAAYMAPEQAKGKPVDKRVDIWAFGGVVYEMFTGRRAFGGSDVAETLACVLKDEPDFAALPPAVRFLVQRCLQKDPRRRLRDIGDAAAMLEESASMSPGVASAPARTRIPWAIAAATTLVAAVVGLSSLGRPSGSPPRPVRADLSLPNGWQLDALAVSPLAVSPDGRHVAIAARGPMGASGIVVRELETGGMRVLEKTLGATSLFWSPDGKTVGFVADGAMKRVSIDGGAPRQICTLPSSLNGATWGADGTIVFALTLPGDGLRRVPASGGEPIRILGTASAGELHAMPSFLPDGRHVVYTAYPFAMVRVDEDVSAYVQSLDGGERVRLLGVGARNVQYADGHLLYVAGETLLAHPFDPARRQLRGEPLPIANRVARGLRLRDSLFGASRSGVLVYMDAGTVGNLSQLAWTDRTGRVLQRVGEPALFREVSLSSDATKAAAVIGGSAVWTIDLTRGGVRTRLTSEPAIYNSPIWSPDARRIAFAAGGTAFSGLNLQAADGTTQAERVLWSDSAAHVPSSWSRTGNYILFVTGRGPLSNNDIGMLPLTGDRRPLMILATGFNETRPQLSPDDRWIAYTSDETGEQAIYAARLTGMPVGGGDNRRPVLMGKVRISTGGGSSPQWRGDGRELYYLDRATSHIMAAALSIEGDALRVSDVQPLFALMRADAGNAAPYDVTPDGQRFLVTIPPDGAESAAAPTLVLNWASALSK